VFDTKVAILVLDDLPVWQKLNVTAFLATGIAGAAPEAMGEPYEDSAGRRYARLLGQPSSYLPPHPTTSDGRTAYLARRASSVRPMCERCSRPVTTPPTGRRFELHPPMRQTWSAFALRGPRKDIDKAVKGAKLHP
jgi:hypothetical protein